MMLRAILLIGAMMAFAGCFGHCPANGCYSLGGVDGETRFGGPWDQASADSALGSEGFSPLDVHGYRASSHRGDLILSFETEGTPISTNPSLPVIAHVEIDLPHYPHFKTADDAERFALDLAAQREGEVNAHLDALAAHTGWERTHPLAWDPSVRVY